MKNRNSFVIGMLAVPLALLGLGVAVASNVVTPNSFTPGTTAMAAEVNSNFAAHANAINDNHARISTLESPVASGSLLANLDITDLGAVANAYVRTGGAVTVTHNGPGDYVIQIAGQNLDFATHMISAHAIHIGASYTCTLGVADSLGFADGIRIRVWVKVSNGGGGALPSMAGGVVFGSGQRASSQNHTSTV